MLNVVLVYYQHHYLDGDGIILRTRFLKRFVNEVCGVVLKFLEDLCVMSLYVCSLYQLSQKTISDSVVYFSVW